MKFNIKIIATGFAAISLVLGFLSFVLDKPVLGGFLIFLSVAAFAAGLSYRRL